MAWQSEQIRTPTTIGRIQITLHDYDGITANLRAKFDVEVLDQNGERMADRSGNLEPHLAPTQTAQLVAFLHAMRQKAEEEILP